MRVPRLLLAAALLLAPTRSGRADQLAHLQPPDAPRDSGFGTEIAQEPGLVVLGCSRDDTLGYAVGSVYVFVEEGGSYVFRQKIDSPVLETGTGFGASVALDEGRIVVGSWRSSSSNPNPGWVHVFEPSGGRWALAHTLVPPGLVLGSNYGAAVTIDGDVLLASAPNEPHPGAHGGSVYVFRWNGGAWVQDQELRSPVSAEHSGFGSRLALDGRLAVIGQESWSTVAKLHAFVDDGSSWAYDGSLMPLVPAERDGFGASVDVSGDTIVVGADERHGGDLSTGAVFVFEEVGGAWSETAFLTVPGARPWEAVGNSVALEGDRLLVGSPNASTETVGGAGYLFERAGTDWTCLERLVPCDLAARSRPSSTCGGGPRSTSTAGASSPRRRSSTASRSSGLRRRAARCASIRDG